MSLRDNRKMPEQGLTREQLVSEINEAHSHDVSWKNGRSFGLVYYAGDDVDEVIREAVSLFSHSNALDPKAFHSLKKFENEVIASTAALLNAESEAVGTMTSGGSESLLMAVKSARDEAKSLHPELTVPEIVLAESAHPALHKAAHYLGVKAIPVPLDEGYRLKIDAVESAINKNTIMLVGSAPAYPHGVVDPIPEMGQLALKNNLKLHVDACLGGFMLPFLEKLGEDVPPFDFRVEGVTSISADLHKYGYASKGASTIIYRDPELRRHQFYIYTDWPGGLFGSSTITGTRPGGPIAAAWAVLNYLGEAGYKRLAGEVMETTRILQRGIESTGKLKVAGKPVMGVFSVVSDEVDVYALADALSEKGWQIGRQQLPPALHFIVTPVHTKVREEFLADLKNALQEVEHLGPETCEWTAAMYAMMGTMCDQHDLYSFTMDFLDSTYRLTD